MTWSALLQLAAGDESFEWGYNQQMTMFQPVGGIDQIAKAFEREVGRLITYRYQVMRFSKHQKG